MTTVVGVDACRKGWVAIVLKSNRPPSAYWLEAIDCVSQVAGPPTPRTWTTMYRNAGNVAVSSATWRRDEAAEGAFGIGCRGVQQDPHGITDEYADVRPTRSASSPNKCVPAWGTV